MSDTRDEPTAPGTEPGIGPTALALIHDLLNAMQVVEARLSLSLGRLATEHPARLDAEAAHAANRDAARMAADVLRAERVAHAVEPVDLWSVLRSEVERATRAVPGISVRVRTPAGQLGALVPGPESYVQRVLGNVLRNAFRHGRRQVEVGVESAERGDQHGFRVTVDDDGPGVGSEEPERIFALDSATEGGYGLGLASARWAAGRLRGAVECDPAPAPRLGGARFTVWLPAIQPVSEVGVTAPVRLAQTSPHLLAPLAGSGIVLVEDTPAVRRVLARVLRRAGATVHCPSLTGFDQAQWWMSIRNAAPRALVVDLDLGARTGLDIWRALLAHAPELAKCVFFLSGAGGSFSAEARAQTGRPVLLKPVDLDELVAIVGHPGAGTATR